MALPFRIAARPPWIATGTIGTCASIAMMKPPFLNGQQVAGAAAGAFGKDQERVAGPRATAAPLAIDAIAFSRSPRSIGDEPADVEHRPHDRKLVQLGLVEDVQLRVQRLEQHRRIDVALVVRAEDDRRSPGTCSRPADPVADAGQRQRQPDAAVPERVHAALPPEDARR